MAISADDFKRRYAELSDEGLLAINRDELTPLARDVYDQEVAERKLGGEDAASEGESQLPGTAGAIAESEEAADPFQELAMCTSVEEAVFYRNLLREAGIEVRVPMGGQFSVNWAGVSSAMDVPLMVRESQMAEAAEIMEASISDEDLAAQAEAAAPKEIEPEEEDIESE